MFVRYNFLGKGIFRMLKILSFVTLLFIFSVAAYADQAAYITKAQAEKAAVFLTSKKQITHYCHPCDDHSVRTEDIVTVEAVPAGYQDYWEVKVNGVGIDLAYVYFNKNDGKEGKTPKWRNVAKKMNIKVHDVPKKLPGVAAS